MNKTSEIKISITKALITRVSIDLDNGEKPKYVISGWLVTEQGKKVSEFTFWNESWVNIEKQVEIPVNIHMYASEIFKALKPIIYKKLNDEWPQLPENTGAIRGEEATIINPDDEVPF